MDTFVDHHQVYFQGGGSMNGLTPGRMVHFVYQDGSHLAAIVAEVMEPDERYTPLVRLFVLSPVQPHYQTAFYDEGMEVGTWHWIERA